MLNLWKVFVAVALLSLLGSASARRSLSEFCTDLSLSAASNQDADTSPQVDMKEALMKLTDWSYEGMEARRKLAKAWETVANEEPCNERSAHHVAIIGQCKPEDHAELSSLAEAVRKYTDRCLTSAFWDAQLKKKLEGILVSGDKTGLASFMDNKFIEQYRADNPEETEVQFANVDAEMCCKPWRSHASVFVGLQDILGESKLEHAIDNWVEEPGKLEEALELNLFKPCNRYWVSTYDLMGQVIEAAKYHKGGSEAFVGSLSPEFRNAIFRYRYCTHLMGSQNPSDKLAKIGVSEFSRQIERQKNLRENH